MLTAAPAVDLELESSIDPELRSWLAFAAQRLQEITALTRGLNEGQEAIADELADASAALRPGPLRPGP